MHERSAAAKGLAWALVAAAILWGLWVHKELRRLDRQSAQMERHLKQREGE